MSMSVRGQDATLLHPRGAAEIENPCPLARVHRRAAGRDRQHDLVFAFRSSGAIGSGCATSRNVGRMIPRRRNHSMVESGTVGMMTALPASSTTVAAER